MNNTVTRLNRILAVLAAAAAASHAALAQEGGAGRYPYQQPDNSVSVGVGLSSGDDKDRARFGIYNGLRKDDANLMLDFNYSNRDAATGRWMLFEGRNLGLDNRELAYTYRNLGDFRLKVDYGELVRHDPRTINTLMGGVGTNNPVIQLLNVPGTGGEVNLELKRKTLGLDLSKRYGNFELEVEFKNQDKTGARQTGMGFNCSATLCAVGGGGTQTALFLLPEPIDSTIRQLDVKLNYAGEKLKLSGGYYGSMYTNNFGSMSRTILGANKSNMNGGVEAWDASRNTFQTPIALPPDNLSHQFYLSGNYKLASHTKLNFKASYTRATQNENFGGMGLAGPLIQTNAGIPGSLNGEVNNTKLQVGFSSHPLAKMHVHGDLLYDTKENKTPLAFYNQNAAGTARWTNSNMAGRSGTPSWRRTIGCRRISSLSLACAGSARTPAPGRRATSRAASAACARRPTRPATASSCASRWRRTTSPVRSPTPRTGVTAPPTG